MKQMFAIPCFLLFASACATRMPTKAGLLSPGLFPDYFGIQWRANEANWKLLGEKTSCANVANGEYMLSPAALNERDKESNIIFRFDCVRSKPQTRIAWRSPSRNASQILLDSHWIKDGQNLYFATKWPLMDVAMQEQLALSAPRVQPLVLIYRVQIAPGHIRLVPSAVSQSQKNGLDFYLDKSCLRELASDEPSTVCAFVPIRQSDLLRKLEREVLWQSTLPLLLWPMSSDEKKNRK